MIKQSARGADGLMIGMNTMTDMLEKYLLVRRAVAAIAYQDKEIDAQERRIIAASIADLYQLTDAQLELILDDAEKMTPVEELVSKIDDMMAIKCLIHDVISLAIMKQEWDDSELIAARRAISALLINEKERDNVLKAFDLLRSISSLEGCKIME